MVLRGLVIEESALSEFCRRWSVVRLSVFGSITRDDFTPESDIDVLCEFEANHSVSVLGHVRMEQELSRLLGRRAEITSRGALDEGVNPRIRESILSGAHELYAA